MKIKQRTIYDCSIYYILCCCSEKQTSVHSDQHYYHSRAAHVLSGNSAITRQQHLLDVDSPVHSSKQFSSYSGSACDDITNNSAHSHASYNAACMVATRGQQLNDTFPPRHYNAHTHLSKASVVDATLARRLDGDFRQASRELECSRISSSSAASTQPEPLGRKSSSSNGDKDANLIQMTASNDDLDVSLEYETTAGFCQGHQGNGSPQYRQQQQAYYDLTTDLAGHPQEMHRALKIPVTPSRSRSVEMLDRVHIDNEVRHSVPTRHSEHVSRSRVTHECESEASGTSKKRERAPPINSARLRAICQRTRNAVVGLLRSWK